MTDSRAGVPSYEAARLPGIDEGGVRLCDKCKGERRVIAEGTPIRCPVCRGAGLQRGSPSPLWR